MFLAIVHDGLTTAHSAPGGLVVWAGALAALGAASIGALIAAGW